MIIPDYYFVGAPKAASTWLYECLKEHKDIYLPPDKDSVKFFDIDYYRGLEWYEQNYFNKYNGQSIVMEFTQSYMIDDMAPKRIALHKPDAKILMCLRNPVDRAFLHYYYKKSKQRTTGYSSVKGFNEEMKKREFKYELYQMWLKPGFYYNSIRRFRKFFPQENIKPLQYEKLLNDPYDFIQEVLEFIGADTSFHSPRIYDNCNADKPDEELMRGVDYEVRRELIELYRDDIKKLQDYTGWDLSQWMDPNADIQQPTKLKSTTYIKIPEMINNEDI